jgi:hypothetical protein
VSFQALTRNKRNIAQGNGHVIRIGTTLRKTNLANWQKNKDLSCKLQSIALESVLNFSYNLLKASRILVINLLLFLFIYKHLGTEINKKSIPRRYNDRTRGPLQRSIAKGITGRG